jgi:hypothetical protein
VYCVYDSSYTEIVGSNFAGGMDTCSRSSVISCFVQVPVLVRVSLLTKKSHQLFKEFIFSESNSESEKD